jgi:5-methyltetrahydropteroyltriglutamate--homocysteine methyltransferase
MAQRTRPPFRADPVGSLIRPQELREARQAHLQGQLPATELRALEDRLIREVVAMQERVGLQAVTDGEFRRTSFREVLFESMEGFSKERIETDFAFSYPDGSTRRATPVPKVVARLRRGGSMAAGDFRRARIQGRAQTPHRRGLPRHGSRPPGALPSVRFRIPPPLRPHAARPAGAQARAARCHGS